MKKALAIVVIIGVIVSLSWGSIFNGNSKAPAPVVTEPTEEITYSNSSADLITVDLPFPGAVVGKEFSVLGKARGGWYFEASFPIQIFDKDGKVLFEGPVQAQGDWMTPEFVPFKVDIKIPASYIGPATILLKNDNPSGLPENDKSISFPITIEY